jgi:hypothetical protein
MSKMKESEVLSHFLCPEGRKDLGRDIGNLIVKSLVIGGEETHIVEDDSLKVRGIGGSLIYWMVEGVIWERGAYLRKGAILEGALRLLIWGLSHILALNLSIPTNASRYLPFLQM